MFKHFLLLVAAATVGIALAKMFGGSINLFGTTATS